MQAMEIATSHEPVGYVWLNKFLPATLLVNTFANFFMLLITLGAYGPHRRFWDEFETFVSLAWLLFLMALTLGVVAQMIMTFQRDHVVDAFGRGRDGYRKWRDGGMGNKTWAERFTVAFVTKMPITLIITIIMLLGFLFCSLAVVSHSLTIGWIGFTWTILMMLLAIITYFMMEHA